MSKSLSEMIASLVRDEHDDVVVIRLTPYARATLDNIKRDFETDEDAINRILDTLYATSPDFDHFYGEPKDGRGPSGE